MQKPNTLISVLMWLVVCAYSFAVLFGAVSRFPYHSDEVSWFFHTEFFQFFASGNIQSARWQSYESYDHPQLTKYIFGAVLSFRHPDVFQRRLELEREYGRWRFYDNPKLPQIMQQYFAPYIQEMRYVNLLFSLVTVLLLWKITSRITAHPYTSIIVPIVLLQNELFLKIMIRATPDAQVVCFIILSWYFLLLFADSKKRIYLYFFTVSAAFAISSKLTGLISVMSFGFYSLLSAVSGSRKELKSHIRQFVGSVTGIFIIWVLLNPALYWHPFQNTFHYIDFRLNQSVILANYYKNLELPTISSKATAIICSVFTTSCTGVYERGSLTGSIWINLMLFAAGLLHMYASVKQEKNQLTAYVNCSYLCMFLVTTSVYLPLNMDRYLMPIGVIVIVIQCIGAIYIASEVYMNIKNPALRRG